MPCWGLLWQTSDPREAGSKDRDEVPAFKNSGIVILLYSDHQDGNLLRVFELSLTSNPCYKSLEMRLCSGW